MPRLIQCHDCGTLFDEDERNDGGFVNTLCPACVSDAESELHEEAVAETWAALDAVTEKLRANVPLEVGCVSVSINDDFDPYDTREW